MIGTLVNTACIVAGTFSIVGPVLWFLIKGLF